MDMTKWHWRGGKITNGRITITLDDAWKLRPFLNKHLKSQHGYEQELKKVNNEAKAQMRPGQNPAGNTSQTKEKVRQKGKTWEQ